MFRVHESIDTPPDDTNIWRYLEFWKFEYLLAEASLWFARGDTLADRREGSLPLLNATEVGAEREGATPFKRELLETYFVRNRKITFVNCWHIGTNESAAMWDLYIPSRGGVAVRSTVGRLKEALKDARPDVFMGRLKYIDFRTETMEKTVGIPGPFFFKHKSYEYERELRAAVIQGHTSVAVDEWMREGGLPLPIRLSPLIQSVVISPRAAPGFAGVVCGAARRLGLALQISDSELSEEPRL